ncbi:Alpha/Beta hydrolase protein [Zopfochytrium polystomum]|nr:Alpha/Beta hydrolase protein [Zopfochytrium polystomum]
MHLGIPYAQAPVQTLRFLAPKRITSNLGERNATSFGATCIQSINSIYPFAQSEDCLFINVFAPADIHQSIRLPVMVWVYGGNFDSGSSSFSTYDGLTMVGRSIELGQEVIVVSFNYRLGVFGFLASPEIQEAGGSNAGLKDQAAAFEWIRENIEAFGGDATRVTAFGESAGSCSIANHLASKRAIEGVGLLFDAAILQSGGIHLGSVLNWTTVYETTFRALSRATQCGNLACLRGLSANALRAAQVAVRTVYRPYVDEDYIPTNPQNRLASGDFMHIPILAGTNTNEGTLFTGISKAEEYSMWVSAMFPMAATTLLDPVHGLYPLSKYNSTVFGTDAAPFLAAADLIGDWMFQCPTQALLDAYALFSTAHDPADGKPLVFRYHFNYLRTDVPSSDRILGVAHASEIPFAFGAAKSRMSSSDEALAREMVSIWTFFGQSAGRRGLNGWKGQSADWPKFEAGSKKQLRIDGAGSYAVEVDDGRREKCTAVQST